MAKDEVSREDALEITRTVIGILEDEEILEENKIQFPPSRLDDLANEITEILEVGYGHEK